MSASTVNVRYMVDDVDAAVAFYTNYLGFTPLSNAAPAFADVACGSLRLLPAGQRARRDVPCRMGKSPLPAAGTASNSL